MKKLFRFGFAAVLATAIMATGLVSCKPTKDNHPCDHTWDGGVVTKDSTTEAEGEKTFTCTACGETRTEPIPKREKSLLANKVIDGVECQKTGEIEICKTTTTIAMNDDSAWDGYVKTTGEDDCKGVYIKDRTVTLSPFAMGMYEVTQELFKAVMGRNPS